MAQRTFARPHTATWSTVAHWLGRRALPLTLTIGGIGLLVSAGTVLWWSKDLPNPENISKSQGQESTKIYDRTGQKLLYEFGDVHRTNAKLQDISLYLRQATLAAEDDKFYEHHGVDILGIIRAALIDLRGGHQGGSTITQQLIKNSILTPERTLRRKVKEAVLAIELEQRFNKDQIFEMYLNNIPYGSRAYGIEAASQTFFNKSSADLTLAEAATLAALPNAPSYYSPYGSHIEDLKSREEHILNRMVQLKMVSADQAEAAKKEQFHFVPHRESIIAPHFVFYAKELLDNEYGERVVEEGGLKITTTLDADMQAAAEQVLKDRQATLKKLGASNAALVAIDPKTGDILAMAGSIDYFDESIDGNVNVAIRERSPGSSIKPFVYAAAFQKGYTPDTILVDAETDFGQGYKPRNYNLQQHGPVTMRTALSNSLNIPAVQTLYLVGVREATALAQKMGITTLTDPDRYGLSLVLGGGEVRLLDEVSAYGVFANDGLRQPHRAILKVEDKTNTIFDAKKDVHPGEQVLEPQISRLVTDVLSDNNARSLVFGLNSPLQLGSRPVAAKTGTTQEFRDGWTIGYTPSLVAGVWVGNNDNSSMNKKSDSGLTAAPIWNAFMRKALANKPIEQFVKPEPQDTITNGILKGQLPEVKAKWVKETNTVYGLDCPINIGQPKTFKELHSILYYVRKDNPQGPPPDRPELDGQFANWEGAVATWRDQFNQKTADDPTQPQYVASLPTPTCDVQNGQGVPKVSIVEPDTTKISSNSVHIVASIDSDKPIKEVHFLVDGQEIAKRGPEGPFEADMSVPSDFRGRKTLVIEAITEDNIIGQAHRTFIVNSDDSAPSVSLLTPTDGTQLDATSFPITLKASAQDPSGIDSVDFLFKKDGNDGASRINRATTVSPTAPNRYEVIWNDSPGPGQYQVYAIAYDKTGNFTQTDPVTITVK